jgi:hypothetical protein
MRVSGGLIAAALLLGGCGGITTTSRDGKVGDTLSAGPLRATVTKVAREVPRFRWEVR